MLKFVIKLSTFLFLASLSSNCFILKKNKNNDDLLNLFLLGILLAEPACTFDPNGSDPLFADQWHLSNQGQLGGTVLEDARVSAAWNAGVIGRNVTVSVVDDGLDVDHEDLASNVSRNVSGINLITDSASPRHMFSNSAHGTAVGGVIAARGGNGLGGRGAAPCAKLVGINILEQNTISGTDEFSAMTHRAADIHISNNSWGSPDNYGWLWPSTSLWREGIQNGLTNGRNGKGTIYLWAAGNGANPNTVASPVLVDDSNYDGQANYYGVMAIGGIGQNGKKATYSENGANLWAVAHTQGNNATAYTTAITTTDASGARGFNTGSTSGELGNANYTKKFNGTSSATPLAAGAVALLLEKYPNLSWRDVRELIAKSARKNDDLDADWTTNGAGFNINHKYGFGAIDANSLLNEAASWTPISGDQKLEVVDLPSLNISIPDNTGASATRVINVPANSISNIEFVDLEFGSDHTYFADLTIRLISPGGVTQSTLSQKHICISAINFPNNQCFQSYASASIADFNSNNPVFRFGTARHLGESPQGNWTVEVTDNGAGDTGNITSLRLRFYGR